MDASTVIPFWSWGQHDYGCRRVQLLVHGLWSVKRGLDHVLFSKGYELPFKEISGDKAHDPRLKIIRPILARCSSWFAYNLHSQSPVIQECNN